MQLDQHVPARGLYDPRFEHDACGIGFVADRSTNPSHTTLTLALTAVGNMAHRGGIDADGQSGDGAGVLTQIPRLLFARELARFHSHYPIADLAVGMLFLPQDEAARTAARALVAQGLAQHGLMVIGWRAVPVEHSALGRRAASMCPTIEQVLIGRQSAARMSPAGYERTLYLARKTIEASIRAHTIVGFSAASFSSTTIVYKGLLIAPLLAHFYPDLQDPLYQTALAVFHQRYSTNTFPTWERAQPFRMLSHNGEINTLQGNITWMQAREAEWRQSDDSPAHPPQPLAGGRAIAQHVARLGPVVDTSGSDSAMLDNVLELLVMGGRDIRHAMAMLVPEAWEYVPDMDADCRAFYQYHAGLMEPWDGPAALAFSDGQVVGLALDRNGLRPARYVLTDDGLVICGSEAGAVPIDERRIVRKGKVGPGQMIAVDLHSGSFEENVAIKRTLAHTRPYAQWLERQMHLFAPASAPHYSAANEPESAAAREAKSVRLGQMQQTFGYTTEELAVILRPMARDGQEPIGSMGDDTPTAVLADRPRPLYNYFKQRFAEVTNPPIDPLREALVMSLACTLGRRGHLLEEGPHHAHLLRLASPILSDEHVTSIRSLHDPAFASAVVPALFPTSEGPTGLFNALERICQQAEHAIAAHTTLLIISDRHVDETHAPIPALLALGAIHHHLIRQGQRTSVSLIVESGEPREVHHIACLIGMGAEAVNPYLALATIRALAADRESKSDTTRTPDEAEQHYIQALEKGLLKILSKIGIATIDSYCGAQVFEALGISDDLIARYFTGVPARLGGIGLAALAANVLSAHDAAFANRLPLLANHQTLPHPGFYKFKKDGEYHAFAPAIVHALQKAVSGNAAAYRTYSDLVQRRPPTDLRDLLDFTAAPAPIPLAQVEPTAAIIRRFSTAAMSHGSTSSEAHETLAIAMNRLGGLSNSGEGGEDPQRYHNERNSPIKQIASGRFGVTPAYLMSASELQIKMAQGSKPGEGGQLPAHKVTEEIARIRHTMPGIALISPPPHHDIYSIEDLAQLIYDLTQINPHAHISVKLVAEAGIGTIAAGVAKGGADIIHISGHSGGTGASPLSSIKNAGVHWELGLAETQHTLVINHLRSHVRLRIDGGLKTGRDVIIAALLGADEYSFGTAALIAEGCVMARTCHTNNCPVGIATQRPDLRARFTGTPEHIMHFFQHIADEVRNILAMLGMQTLEELIGRSDLLHPIPRDPRTTPPLDLTPLIARIDRPGDPIRNTEPRNTRVALSDLNAHILADAMPALTHSQPLTLHYHIRNSDRTIGATLSGALTTHHGPLGLPAGTITIHCHGSAGQSFGAFLAPGIRLLLTGEANDYVGKSMAGGEIIIRPPADARYHWHESTIIGNTVLYGATGGACYAAGRAGERFAVRNSGAIAVIEGIGDHGCEYMTGGIVLILGPTGRNFAAGMTGGLAYILDTESTFPSHLNPEHVTCTRLDGQDDSNIRTLLQRHHDLTNSPHAATLLDQWALVRNLFWRITPRGQEAHLPEDWQRPRAPALDHTTPEKRHLGETR